MPGKTPDRFRTLFVAVSDPPKSIADWSLKVLGAKAVKAGSVVELFPGAADRVELSLQPRKRPGDVVSQTVLGACACFRGRRLPKAASARVERLCQRIFDTTMTVACISDADLTERATSALAQLARQTGALVFDGCRVFDELGRLALDLKGKSDAAALSPQFAVVSSVQPLPAKGKTLNGVTLAALTPGKAFRFSAVHERHLKYLGLKPRSSLGQARIAELAAFFKTAKPRLYLERSDDEGDVLAVARAVSRGRVAVLNDGWAFYGPDGRVLLDRNGELDPKAQWPLA